MLANLVYCASQATARNTALEPEWRRLYPNSLLTARNLKSRLTVYQRTHSERSAPLKPTQERSGPAPRPAFRSRSSTLDSNPSPQHSPAPARNLKQSAAGDTNGDTEPDVKWSEAMVTDMFSTLDRAREELDSVEAGRVNSRWHELWRELHPASSVTQHQLHSRYRSQVKRASNYIPAPAQSPGLALSPVGVGELIVEEDRAGNKMLEVDRTGEQTAEEGAGKHTAEEDKAVKSMEEEDGAVEQVAEEDRTGEQTVEEHMAVSDNHSWTDEKLAALWREKLYVEDKLRCIQDEHFYELLHDRWTNLHPNSKENPDSLKTILETFKNLKQESLVKQEQLETNNNADLVETSDDKVKEEDIKEELANASENVRSENLGDYICKEQPVEVENVSKSRWACQHHYIHVFYSDEAAPGLECVLTDQLLQLRAALVNSFPGQDLTRPGKKPPGFAKLLLAEWTRLYPDTRENTKTISMKIAR